MRSRFLLALLLGAPAWAFDSAQLKKIISAPASVKSPVFASVAVEASGRIWISDSANHQLHAYNASGEYTDSVGKRGIGPGEFTNPQGIAVSPEGQLYVADSGNARVQILSSEGRFLDSFGQRGAEPGQMKAPWLITISRDGVVLVVDKDASRVQLFSKDGVFLQAIETSTPIDGLTVDPAGRIYTTHQKTNLIEQRSSAGQLLKTWTGVEPGMKGFGEPGALAVSGNGVLYLADENSSHFREMDLNGRTLGVFGRAGSGEGQFRSLKSLAVLADTIYVCDPKSKRVTALALTRQTPLPPIAPVPVTRLQVKRQEGMPGMVDRIAWNPDGTLHALLSSIGVLLTYDLSTKTTTQIDLKSLLNVRSPAGLATAPSSGNIFVSDTGNNRVLKLDKTGQALLEFKNISRPRGLVCSPQGMLFVIDAGERFQAFNHQGLFQFAGGEKGAGPGQLKNPVALAWDKEVVYVADVGNKKVVAFNSSGRFLREMGKLGPEVLEEPVQVTLDREGNLFVLDAARSRIVAYDAQGVYLGGFGTPGKAPGSLYKAHDFALNDNGDLIVAEEGRLQAFKVVLLPPAPSQLSAEGGEGHVTLKWNAVKTRIPARYVVSRMAPDGKVEVFRETLETRFIDDSLIAETTYSYTVAAQSVQGALSVPSARVSAMATPITSGPRVDITATRIDEIFSSHYKYYSRVPVGHIKVRNNGAVPVQNLKVLFALQGFMDYPSETVISELGALEEKEVEFTATFNNRILEVNETTPIQAQVKVIYFNGDQPVTAEKNLPFKLYSRNSIRWEQKEQFASFVTPNDPPVVDFVRHAAVPFIESRRSAPLPPAILSAWSVFSALGTYGISYVPRPNNPYDRVSLDTSTVDSLQFARETLSRKSGDCSDVVALLSSALESLTVATAALDVPGHLFLMFDTGVSQKELLGLPDPLLVSYGGSYWIPLEATMLGSPFLAAWKQGAAEYQKWVGKEKLRIIDIHAAWRTYEPATLPDIASGAKAPTREAIEEKFLADWKALVELRWQTSHNKASEATTKDPNAGEPWMRLGFLAVDFKRYEEAKEYFIKARGDSKTAGAAYNNLGNLAFIRGDMESAFANYTQAVEKDPMDAQIHMNLARFYLKQGKPQKAQAAYEKATTFDKTLREQYPDVSSLAP
jgi:DNA-binding beta-propeller fold protein YncE